MTSPKSIWRLMARLFKARSLTEDVKAERHERSTGDAPMRLIAAIRLVVAMLLLALAPSARGEGARTLDPKIVHGMRMMLRDDARSFGTTDTHFIWATVGIHWPSETVTPARARAAFNGNAIAAERRFSQSFNVRGALYAVRRRPDQKIVVVFKEGGAAADQRRALRGLAPPGYDPGEMMSGLTGGLMYPGATAVLDTQYEDAVADWKEGQEVQLRCKGANNVRLALLLDGCVPLSSIFADADRIADQQLDRLLAGESIEVVVQGWLSKEEYEAKDFQAAYNRPGYPTKDEILLSLYATGLLVESCQQTDFDAWKKCTNPLTELTDRKRGTLTQQASRDLGIPVPASKPTTPTRPASKAPKSGRE